MLALPLPRICQRGGTYRRLVLDPPFLWFLPSREGKGRGGEGREGVPEGKGKGGGRGPPPHHCCCA